MPQKRSRLNPFRSQCRCNKLGIMTGEGEESRIDFVTIRE